MPVVRFKDGTECPHHFFYLDGNDLHLVLEKTLVEVANIVATSDLSEISNVVGGDVVMTVKGYTEIVLLHPQDDGVRVGLRKK